MSNAELIRDSSAGKPPVFGYLHAAGAGGDFLVLTHGAGGNLETPLLILLAEKFAASGVSVLRCDLPFRQRRRTGPPSTSDARNDQEGLRRALELMRDKFSGRGFLGGSSYGGRQASMLAASDASLAAGLLLLSYPLHPPGRPAQMRTAHFAQLQTPALFISGTRDAFGSIEELSSAIRLIPARTRLVAVEGASHGLLQKSNRAEVTEVVTASFREFFPPPR